MNNLKVFKNEEFGEIRTLEINNEPWFVGKDVASILGYGRPDNAIRNHVDDEDRLMHQISASGQNRNMLIINESGLYSLIMSSRVPSAKKFKRWVTSEVLPSVRKHGAYMTDEVLEKTLNDPDFMINLLTNLKEERKARIEAERKNAVLMHTNKTYTVTEIAKELGFKSAISLNKDLCERGIQYKVNRTYVLYSEYADMGLVSIKQQILDNGHEIYNRHFTQEGRNFLLELYKGNLKND